MTSCENWKAFLRPATTEPTASEVAEVDAALRILAPYDAVTRDQLASEARSGVSDPTLDSYRRNPPAFWASRIDNGGVKLVPPKYRPDAFRDAFYAESECKALSAVRPRRAPWRT